MQGEGLTDSLFQLIIQFPNTCADSTFGLTVCMVSILTACYCEYHYVGNDS